MTFKRGTVLWVVWPDGKSDIAVGTEAKERPVIVVQSDKFEPEYPQWACVQVTTQLKNFTEHTIHVPKDSVEAKQAGFPKECYIKVDRIGLIDTKWITHRTTGIYPKMDEIDKRLRGVLDLQ